MTPEKVERTIAKRKTRIDEDKRRRRREAQKRTDDAVGGNRRVYHAPDITRAAFYAGQGKTAVEIATAVGGTSPHRIRALLQKLGLELHPRRRTETTLVVSLDRRAASAFERIAAEIDVPTDLLVGRFLSSLGVDPTLVRNLLDGVEV